VPVCFVVQVMISFHTSYTAIPYPSYSHRRLVVCVFKLWWFWIRNLSRTPFLHVDPTRAMNTTYGLLFEQALPFLKPMRRLVCRSFPSLSCCGSCRAFFGGPCFRRAFWLLLMPYFEMPRCIKMEKTRWTWWERLGKMPPFWVQAPCNKTWNNDKRDTPHFHSGLQHNGIGT
jgi:hypothetical protein